jgi:hypothetical protein
MADPSLQARSLGPDGVGFGFAAHGRQSVCHEAQRRCEPGQIDARPGTGQLPADRDGLLDHGQPLPHAWVYLQACLCAEPEVMFGDALQGTSHLSGRQGEAEQPTGRNEVSGTVNGSGSTSA